MLVTNGSSGLGVESFTKAISKLEAGQTVNLW